MPTLRIRHEVQDFDDWKRMFDSDPIDRKGSGVQRYEIQRSVTEPNLVMIDLAFDNVEGAEGFLKKLQQLWEGPAKAAIRNPMGRILETVESADL